MMFAALQDLSFERAVSIVHAAIRMLHHPSYLQIARNKGSLPGSETLSPDDVRMALSLVKDVERRAGAPVERIPGHVLGRYTGKLSDLVLERTRKASSVTDARTARLLESLRNDVQ